MGGRANPVVTRFYLESSEADFCAQAVRLLLDFTERKQRATGAGGPDDAERSSNESKASGATQIVQE